MKTIRPDEPKPTPPKRPPPIGVMIRFGVIVAVALALLAVALHR